jgi:hypothetical protein
LLSLYAFVANVGKVDWHPCVAHHPYRHADCRNGVLADKAIVI